MWVLDEKKIEEEFELRKNSKCSICGGNTTNKCLQQVGSLNCDSALCNSNVCNYVHNLKHHYSNKDLVNKYGNKISNKAKLELLEKEIQEAKKSKEYYLELTNKYAQHDKTQDVSLMFRDLVNAKQREIHIFEREIFLIKTRIMKKKLNSQKSF